MGTAVIRSARSRAETEASRAGSSARPASSTQNATANAEVKISDLRFDRNPNARDKIAATRATAKINLLAIAESGFAAKYSHPTTPSTSQVIAIVDEITRRRRRLRADERLALTASKSASGGIAGRM